MNSLKDYRVGDTIIINSRLRDRTERRIAQVVHINYRGNGMVGFAPVTSAHDRQFAEEHGLQHSGQGAFDPAKLGTKPFGKQSVALIGRRLS